MAYKNFAFIVIIAVLIQNTLAGPITVDRWRQVADENEVFKTNQIPSVDQDETTAFNAVRDIEEIEVDVGNVDIPTMDIEQKAQFIHDFNVGKTAIVDEANQLCFVMELDEDRYQLPTSLFDLFLKMRSDYYAVDLNVVRQNMRVVFPALDNLEPFGVAIQLHCEQFSTYRLENVESRVIFKRAAPSHIAVYREKVGNRLYNVEIMNYDDLLSHERKE